MDHADLNMHTAHMQSPYQLRFRERLSSNTTKLLKEQVRRMLRDQEKDVLFDRLMSWEPSDSEIMLYSDYSTFEAQLPLRTRLLTPVTATIEATVPIAVINGWAPVNMINRGHRYVCLLQFKQPVPEEILLLREVNAEKEAESEVIFEIIR